MPNRQLLKDELALANQVLQEIRERISLLSNGDSDLLFAYRRKIFKELTYDERGGPTHRRKLKALKRIEQLNICPICRVALPEKYAVLDRFNAADGYTAENTRLIHPTCDVEIQVSRGYA